MISVVKFNKNLCKTYVIVIFKKWVKSIYLLVKHRVISEIIFYLNKWFFYFIDYEMIFMKENISIWFCLFGMD